MKIYRELFFFLKTVRLPSVTLYKNNRSGKVLFEASHPIVL